MNSKATKNRRPWNRVPEQIYSLSTLDAQAVINMNIVSYATPATLKPKSYIVAVYRSTKTHANIFDNKSQRYCLIQALSQAQIGLVRNLGQKSALKYNKVKFLSNQNLSLFNFEGCDYGYLPSCGFVILCKITKRIELGDHDLISAEVVKIIHDDKDQKLLTTGDLISAGIIL